MNGVKDEDPFNVQSLSPFSRKDGAKRNLEANENLWAKEQKIFKGFN
jgi:hypothetical protein